MISTIRCRLVMFSAAAVLALSGCAEQAPSDAPSKDVAASAESPSADAPSADAQVAATPVSDPSTLAAPIAQYKIYVAEQSAQAVRDTRRFVEAVKAGKLDEAAALYAPSRQAWERIEPIAELFGDLDASIDARVDDYKGGVDDPNFTGWHRIEYAIFDQKNLKGMAPLADRLLADTQELQTRIGDLSFEPSVVVGGPAALIEEVASTKISGEENRYAGTGLWDFRANVDGSQKIVALFRPLIAKANPDLLAEIETNFTTVDTALEKYRRGDEWANYVELSDADRSTLKGAITALAEQLAQLRGSLGVD